MTLRFRLSETDCVVIAGTEHILASQDADGITLRRYDTAEVHQSFTHAEFLRLLAAPDVQLQRSRFSAETAARRLHNDRTWLQGLPARRRRIVMWRMDWVNEALKALREGEMQRTEASIARLLPTLAARTADLKCKAQRLEAGKRGRTRAGRSTEHFDPPCPRTLLRWIGRYEQFGATLAALLDKRRVTRLDRRKFGEEGEAILRACVDQYLDRGKPTGTEIVKRTQEAFKAANDARLLDGKPQLPTPSPNTIRARLKRLDAFERVAQREGLEVARRQFGFYENGLPVHHPLQRVEMDDWEIDLMTLLSESGAFDGLPEEDRRRFDVGRRWLCVAVDCATRVILGFRITDKPSTLAALDTLRMGTEDRTAIGRAAGCGSDWDQYGTPGSVVTDNGSSLLHPDFRFAAAALGCKEYPPAGVPKLRGRIESIFKSLGKQLMPILTGRTFGNPVERGDYPSQDLAAYTDDELAQILTIFFVDIYHNSPHEGLGGQTPANAWKRLVAEQGVSPPPDANTRRVVFGLEVTRKLDRHGVWAFGVAYTAPKLRTLFMRDGRQEVKVRVDPFELSHVSVLIGEDWVPAQAVSRAVWGLSLTEWQTLVRDLRTRYREEARLAEPVVLAARARIRQIDANARALARLMPTQLRSTDLDRAEQQLFLGLGIRSDQAEAPGREPAPPGDLLGDVISGTAPASPVVGATPATGTAEPDRPRDDGDTPPPFWSFDRD